MTDVGLQIVEGVSSGATPLKNPAKRNIGLLGQFVRGTKVPTRITSMEDFNILYGGQSSSFFGPGIVRSIFKEAADAPVVLYLSRVVGSGAVAATSTTLLSGSVTMEVTAGYKGNEDPGLWGNDVSAVLYSYSSRVRDMFSLVVTYGDVSEQYSASTLAEIQTAVNKTSKYITIEFSAEITKLVWAALTGTATASTSSKEVVGVGTTFSTELSVGDVLYNSEDKVIGTVASVDSNTTVTLLSRAFVNVSGAAIKVRDDKTYTADLSSGVDGTVAESDFYPVESTTDPKGLAVFGGYDVQIIAVTEYHTLTMATKLNDYLNSAQSPVGVINLPLNADEGTAEMYAITLQTSGTSYLAGAYMGWSKVLDDNGDEMLLPVIGAVLGAGYLRTPFVQGDYIHIPPAGSDSLFSTVKDMIPARLSQPTINRLVQQFSCNYIGYIENSGFYVGSSRTYSTNPLHQSIHVRMQTSYYCRALYVNMRYTEQKNNSPELKREALVDLRSFFKTEYDNGALERSIPFEECYTGISDTSNNPSTQDRKLMNIKVLWIPAECTESVAIALQRNDGILTTKAV